MTRRKQGQRVLWEGMIDEDVRALWEPWMVQADRLLEDEELIDRVWEAQGQRHEHSATKGRAQTPAEMVLRLLLLIQGRKLRVDTTVVGTNIHYPTDSSLLGDGARVLTRTMKKIETQAGKLKRKVRNRARSISKRVIAIATASRHKGLEGEAKRKKQYRELLRYTRQMLNDAKRVIAEVEEMSAKKRKGLRGLCEQLSEMAGRVRQVVN